MINRSNRVEASVAIINLSLENMATLEQFSSIFLGYREYERNLWQLLLNGQFVIGIQKGKYRRILMLRVTGKSILTCPGEISRRKGKPFFVTFVYGTGSIDLLDGINPNIDKKWDLIPLSHFGGAMTSLERILDLHVPQDNAASPVFSAKLHSVYVAASAEDFRFVQDVSVYHPFGYRKSFLTLIAKREGRARGALLADFSSDTRRFHQMQKVIFGKDFTEVKARSLTIKRIFSEPRKWCVHRDLIRAVICLASYLHEDGLRILDVMTYEYHPLFLWQGFSVFPPVAIDDSFYYYRPIGRPKAAYPFELNRKEVIMAVKGIVRARGEVGYWLAPAPDQYANLMFDKSAWPIKDHNKNAGRWMILGSGDQIFFYNKKKEIFACGRVKGKEKKIVSEFEDYPLWINLDPSTITRTSYSIFDVMEPALFEALGSGGIVGVSDDVGLVFLEKSGLNPKRRGMTVTPNPFLLHGIDFAEMVNRVFIVQSWELRASVLPILRVILETDGYSVTYSGDREGQVIFGDIWLMLNEAEVVLVDFTQKKPNVYLEYGMALVLGKPIIAITQIKEDLPSDTPQLKYIAYSEKTVYSDLKQSLVRSIEDTREDIHRARWFHE
jgi:hypothetical protein